MAQSTMKFNTSRRESPARLHIHPRALLWLRVAFVGALVGPLLLLAYVGWTSYLDAIEASRDRLVRLAQIAQEHSQRVLETNEVISRSIAIRIGSRTNAELRRDRDELHTVLKSWTRGLHQVQSVWIWDDTGHPVATNLRPDPPTTLDVSDREYFIWAKNPEATGWFVSAPLHSRTTGELFFDFVKRRAAADGSFQGALSVSLRPDYFDAFFREQIVGEPGTTLSLFRADGTLISQFPPPAAGTAANLESSSVLLAAMKTGSSGGETNGLSSVDGQYRYVAFRRISDLPLYAVATGSRETLLGPWRKSMVLLTAFTLPLAMGLAALCWFAMQGVRREHAIALALEQQYDQLLKAEQALRLAQKMEALGRLTGGVAHDFNNVLMVVQSCVALARQLEARGEPVDKSLAPIERAIANGAQLTRQLLAIARRQPLQMRTLDLDDVVPALAQLMSSTLGSSITVTHVLEPGLRVKVDQAELELALMNLCINGRDAMPSGGAIEIHACRTHAPGADGQRASWARITVTDTGEGIPADLLDRVTEPFFTTKPLGQGTGLGLSQVQAFVSESGGQIEIKGAPGRGTQVSLLLPCTDTRAEEGTQRPMESVEQLDAAVLLVEDNADIAEAVSAILHAAGARVTCHTSADSAARAVSGGARFDVVLSDVSLPGAMNGIDLARELTSRRPRIPVVLMTGYTDRLQEATACGFRVVPKPAAPDALLSALIEALKPVPRE